MPSELIYLYWGSPFHTTDSASGDWTDGPVSACASVCHLRIWEPWESIRSHGTGVAEGGESPCGVLGTEPESSMQAESDPKRWALSPDPGLKISWKKKQKQNWSRLSPHLFPKEYRIYSWVVVHTFNPSNLWVQGLPGLQSECQDSQGYTEKPCVKEENTEYINDLTQYWSPHAAIRMCSLGQQGHCWCGGDHCLPTEFEGYSTVENSCLVL